MGLGVGLGLGLELGLGSGVGSGSGLGLGFELGLQLRRLAQLLLDAARAPVRLRGRLLGAEQQRGGGLLLLRVR